MSASTRRLRHVQSSLAPLPASAELPPLPTWHLGTGPRDFEGYGISPPNAAWPNGAKASVVSRWIGKTVVSTSGAAETVTDMTDSPGHGGGEDVSVFPANHMPQQEVRIRAGFGAERVASASPTGFFG